MLAVTPLVADEKPLWVDVDDDGRVTALGERSGSLVTAGMYLVPGHVRRTPPPVGLGRLRDYLGWLHRSGEPLYGEVVRDGRGRGPGGGRCARRGAGAAAEKIVTM